MYYRYYTIGGELYHHGIYGQKWGVKNGPPYPLSSGDHSVSEKKAGWRKSLHKSSNSDAKSKHTKKEDTKYGLTWEYVALRVGLGVTAHLTAKAVKEIAYRLSNDYKKDKEAQNQLDEIRKNRTTPIDEETGFHVKSKKGSMKSDIDAINPTRISNEEGVTNNNSNNCAFCSMAFEMRNRGYDVNANLSKEGISEKNITSNFKKTKNININSKTDKPRKAQNGENLAYAMETCNKLIGQGDSRGILLVHWGFTNSGHAMNYEVKNGKLKVIDTQTKEVLDKASSINMLCYTSRNSYIRLDDKEVKTNRIKRYVG